MLHSAHIFHQNKRNGRESITSRQTLVRILDKLWSGTPLLIKAVIVGFLISTIGVMSWPFVAVLVPLPWSFILMIIILWAYVKYFSGSWGPENSQAWRKYNFRSTQLSQKTWWLSAIGIFLIVLIEQSGLIVTFRLMEFPAERFLEGYSYLGQVPPWMGWLVIIMISVVAGICEEVGFRGYMQVSLEKRYGPVVAISFVSIIFVLVHLHQAWSGPLIVHIFIMSVLFGSIAYVTNSLLPGIIAHVVMDICNFSFWWSELEHQFDKKPIQVTGVDAHFVFWLGSVVLNILLYLYVFKNLKRLGLLSLKD